MTIEDHHLKRIGQIDKQIQEYTVQKIEDACRRVRVWPVADSDAVEEWQKFLAKKLVEVQADGRAVTLTVSRDQFVEEALKHFRFDDDAQAGTRKIDTVIKHLLKPNVALLTDSRMEGSLALGHDSVALSLQQMEHPVQSRRTSDDADENDRGQIARRLHGG